MAARQGAIFDDRGRYRYRLWRCWAPRAGQAVFVMLNPSTADGERDDPTIRRCVGFARRWGLGGVTVVNLFAYRATDPAALRRVRDPIGPANDRHLRAACRGAALVVAAWGIHGRLRDRDHAVLELLGDSAVLRCLGTTAAGAPRHPLYLPATARPRRLPAAARRG